MGSGISSRLGILAGVEAVDEETAKTIVGKYWTSEVQEAFDLQSTAGILDRDTFLRLLQEQQRKRIQRSHAAKETSAGQDSQSKATAGPNSVAAILASAGASGSGIKLAEAPAVGEASYRRKRPQLSLKLGAGAAAAGGAVKLGVNPEAADVAKADFRRKRPQLSLQLGAGAAAGGGAVKLGLQQSSSSSSGRTRESKMASADPARSGEVLNRKRPPGLSLGLGSAAGGGAVKLGAKSVDSKQRDSKRNDRDDKGAVKAGMGMNWMDDFDSGSDGADTADADADSDRLNDSMSLYQDGPPTRPGRASHRSALSSGCLVEDLELTSSPRSRVRAGSAGGDIRRSSSSSRKETPHFSDTGTFHSEGFMIDAGGYRPSPAAATTESKHADSERGSSRVFREAGSGASSSASSSAGTRRPRRPRREHKLDSGSDVGSDDGGSNDYDDDMSVSSVSPFGNRHQQQRPTSSSALLRGQDGTHHEERRSSKKLASEFVELYELGRGAGGRVFKAIHVPTLHPVALKRIKCNTPQKLENLGQEIKALAVNYVPLEAFSSGDHAPPRRAPCPYLTTFHGAYTSDDSTSVTLILELMDGGELQEFVSDGRRCSEPLLANTAFRILKGLAFLHANKQVHRDIKPHNVLLHSEGLCKLSDFGILRSLDENEDFAETFTGTMLYMSPERVEGESYSYPSDIWSVGLLIYTLAEAKFPFINDSFWSLRSRFKANDIPKLPERGPGTKGYSAECCDFVASMLQVDPKSRSTAKELLQHPFIRQHIDDKKRDKLDSTIVKAALAPKMLRKESNQSEKIMRQLQEDSEAPSLDSDSDSGFGFASGASSDDDLYNASPSSGMQTPTRNRSNSSGYSSSGSKSPESPGVGRSVRDARRGSGDSLRLRSTGKQILSKSHGGGALASRRRESGSGGGGQERRRRPLGGGGSSAAQSRRPGSSRARYFENLLSASRTWNATEAANEVELTVRKVVKHQVRAGLPRPTRALVDAFAKSMRVSSKQALHLFEAEWQKFDGGGGSRSKEHLMRVALNNTVS